MTKKSNTEQGVQDNSPLPALSDAEMEAARKEGAKEDVKEAAKDAHRFLTDGQQPGAAPAHQYHGKSDIMQYADLLSLGVEEFEQAVDAKADNPVPEEKAAGLLELERSGQNRTPYVKALMKRFPNAKSPYEITKAGPDYTNPVQPLDKL